MNPQTRLSKLAWLMLALTATLFSLGLVIVGVTLFRVQQSNTIHCYWLTPPLNHTETAILTGRTFNCVVDHCRVVFNTQFQRGLVCYYPRPNSPLVNSLVPP